MGSPYTSQTISDYNTSPPSDDATAVASNQLFWSKHKEKLADPIKTLTEAINTELVATFAKLHMNQSRSISANDTQVAADERKLISCTNSITYTLLPAVTAADGFTVGVLNAGTGTITIDGNASETINGQTSILLSSQYDCVILRCDGTSWTIVHDARRSYDFAINEAKGADIASATTTDIGAATGNYVDVTGTTTITGLGTVQAGTRRIVQFDGALTLTHNGTSLILPTSANITTAAGDVATFVSLGSGNWVCTGYLRASGVALVGGITRETAQSTSSGTAKDFTGIPSNAIRITVIFDDVSLSGTDNILVRIGDSGGIETTGYTSEGATITSTPTISAANGGFVIRGTVAADSISGHMILTNISGNTWVSSHSCRKSGASAKTAQGGGHKQLTSTLDRVRILPSGANTFDGGSVNILIES